MALYFADPRKNKNSVNARHLTTKKTQQKTCLLLLLTIGLLNFLALFSYFHGYLDIATTLFTTFISHTANKRPVPPNILRDGFPSTDTMPRVYVINLDSHRAKAEHLTHQLVAAGVPHSDITRVGAATPSAIANWTVPGLAPLSEKVVSVSHLAAIKTAWDDNQGLAKQAQRDALIVEDDLSLELTGLWKNNITLTPAGVSRDAKRGNCAVCRCEQGDYVVVSWSLKIYSVIPRENPNTISQMWRWTWRLTNSV
jgi:hypothetical protein